MLHSYAYVLMMDGCDIHHLHHLQVSFRMSDTMHKLQKKCSFSSFVQQTVVHGNEAKIMQIHNQIFLKESEYKKCVVVQVYLSATELL